LVDRVVEVKDRKLVYHRLTVAAWWQEKEDARKRLRSRALEDRRAPASEKERARQAFEHRRREKRERDRREGHLRRIEETIEHLENRKHVVERELEAAFSTGGDPRGAEELSREYETLESALAARYAEWTLAMQSSEGEEEGDADVSSARS
jgi:uncharacterized protein (DUF2461 family)